MKKLLALIALMAALAFAGCGGSGSSASAQCAKLRQQANAWAENFVAPMPTAGQAYKNKLASSDLQTRAAQAGVSCP